MMIFYPFFVKSRTLATCERYVYPTNNLTLGGRKVSSEVLPAQTVRSYDHYSLRGLERTIFLCLTYVLGITTFNCFPYSLQSTNIRTFTEFPVDFLSQHIILLLKYHLKHCKRLSFFLRPNPSTRADYNFETSSRLATYFGMNRNFSSLNVPPGLSNADNSPFYVQLTFKIGLLLVSPCITFDSS